MRRISTGAFATILAFGLIGSEPDAVCARAAGLDSSQNQLSKDVALPAGEFSLLKADAHGGQTVYVDGTAVLVPGNREQATLYITVDQKMVSNESLLDWRSSIKPLKHTFRAIGALKLAGGTHKVELKVRTSGRLTVKAGATLSVMTEPADAVQVSQAEEVRIEDLSTKKVVEGKDALPAIAVVSQDIAEPTEPLISLASGYSRHASDRDGSFGDAMWLLLYNGTEPTLGDAALTDNDICKCAEVAAPMYLQGYYLPQPDEGKPINVALAGTTEPWGLLNPENQVAYDVGAGTSLVTFQGGMRVFGRVAAEPDGKGLKFRRFAYQCIATSKQEPGCPPVGQDVVIGRAIVNVPSNHNGVVFFSSITRLQADQKDPGGECRMWLTVDGEQRGSTSEQELGVPSSVSTRTLTATYLASGRDALTPGPHTVEVHARATGRFAHLSITGELPLIWFD